MINNLLNLQLKISLKLRKKIYKYLKLFCLKKIYRLKLKIKLSINYG